MWAWELSHFTEIPRWTLFAHSSHTENQSRKQCLKFCELSIPHLAFPDTFTEPEGRSRKSQKRTEATPPFNHHILAAIILGKIFNLSELPFLYLYKGDDPCKLVVKTEGVNTCKVLRIEPSTWPRPVLNRHELLLAMGLQVESFS